MKKIKSGIRELAKKWTRSHRPINAQKLIELLKTCHKIVIFNSPKSMAFPGLYNRVARVPTEPTTAVATAVITHVLHLLTDLNSVFTCLLYILMYLLYAHVLHLLLCSTYGSLMYVPILKKWHCCKVDRYLLHRHYVPTCNYRCTYAY